MSVLSVRQLSVGYGGSPVLAGITLPRVDAGQIVGLVGPNGSGKSTLLQAVSGLLPSTGEIQIDNGVVPARRSGRTSDVFYMPQSLPQSTTLLCYELLSAYAEMSGLLQSRSQIEERVSVALDELDIGDLAMRPMCELSGGKRQLVGFAIALVQRPRLLLLDEPTSALDLAWQVSLMRAVRRYISQYSAAAIIALHDLTLAARECDALALLSNGKLVAFGSPDDVLTARNIRDVYGVDAHVEKRSSGRLLIELKT